MPIFTTSSYAEEEIENLIDIFESKSRIIAVIKVEYTISIQLHAKEKVLWSGSEGNLGAFLTNDRFFAISSLSRTWQILPLTSGEPEKGVASLSQNIALLVTDARVIGFDAATNRFVEVQLPIRDELIATEIEKNVAVVITSSRIFGFASGTQAFNEIQLRVQESIEEVKITFNKATIRTSDRLLIFGVNGSTWKEQSL